MIELAVPDEAPQATLSEADILDCFLATPMSGSYRQYVVGAGRAIEAKVRSDLPKTDLLRAAAYLAAENDEGSAIDGAEADRIAAVLRELAA